MRKVWRLFALLAVIALSAVLIACGDDDDDPGDDPATTASGTEPAGSGSEEDIAEVEDTIRQIAAAEPDDIDYFLEHTTDNVTGFFGYETEEECRANAEDCIGEPLPSPVIEGTTVDGDTASSTVTGPDFSFALRLIREDDVWQLDEIESGAVEIPEGVEAIEVTAVEYGYNAAVDNLEDGNIAFTMNNEGEEAHELILAKTNDEFDLDAFIASSSEEEGEGEGEEGPPPPGVDEFPGFAFAEPGVTTNLVPEGELAAGNYVMICFIPAPDGESHASKGMYREFEIP